VNFSKAYRKIFQAPYESQVLQLVGFIGFLRVLVAVIQDILSPKTTSIELLTDCGILLVFLGVCFLALRLKVNRISLSVGVVLAVLLALNFMQFGGVTGYTEFNYLTGIALMVLLYSEERKYFLVGGMILLLGCMLFVGYSNHPIYQFVFIRKIGNPEDFVFSLIGITILTLYLKYAMDLERQQLLQQQGKLNFALEQSRSQQATLKDQQGQLMLAQQKLELEVIRRTKQVQIQNASIEQYIQYNTTELREPLEQLKGKLSALTEPGMLNDLLKVSASELETVISNINKSIKDEHFDT
jgi:hypothetical protein